jgi:hypothetical protein
MRSALRKWLVLFFALAAMPTGGFAWAQSSQPQGSQPTGQTAQPKPAPKKTPAKPIDPDETGGVRGSGSPLTVHVLIKGKAVENAHVMVKNANGSLAGSCFTNADGDCKVDVGPDDYVIDVKGSGRTGTLKLHVTEQTGSVTIKLLKAKPATASAQP